MSTDIFQGRFRSRLAMACILAIAVAAGASAKGLHMAMQAPSPHAIASSDLVDEQPFITENNVAMEKMMADMHSEPTGNVDVDFVHMMVPHHQGAIDMAVLELRYGTSPRLKALAQEIVVTQQQEIAAMKLAIGETVPPSYAAPTAPSETHNPSPQ